MRREPNWIDKRALLFLHAESLAEFGGASGIRDEGLLESALARARNLQAYEPKCKLADLAAAYCHGLVKNHPFVDGNKRAGFLAIGLVLEINGYTLAADPVDAIGAILSVAAGELSAEDLARWIAAHIERAS